MVLFEFIKPDMYSVNTGRHTNECLFAAHPVWVVKPQDTSLEEGKPGYLHCQAKASPEPEVTWIRNNLMLMPEVTHTRCIFFPQACHPPVQLYQISALFWCAGF